MHDMFSTALYVCFYVCLYVCAAGRKQEIVRLTEQVTSAMLRGDFDSFVSVLMLSVGHACFIHITNFAEIAPRKGLSVKDVCRNPPAPPYIIVQTTTIPLC